MRIKYPIKFLSRLFILFLLVAALYVYTPRQEPLIMVPHPLITVTLQVGQGDTLWNLAQEISPEDPREAIYLIKKLNGLTNDLIYPGQLLEVPQKEEALQASNILRP
ncbi:MAG: LysM peptidoglycan-binding domain-containing protein [Tissierellia bacterium]|nr:LysM peptidoglycan-binding domain-containing protein [Tissierellia bacterium]